MYKNQNDNLVKSDNLFGLVLLALSIVIIGIIYTFSNKSNENINMEKTKKNDDLAINTIDSEYYKKFHKILFEESGLKFDPYKRKLEKNTVKIFCQIAKKNNIQIDQYVDKNTFDSLYKQLIEYQVSKLPK